MYIEFFEDFVLILFSGLVSRFFFERYFIYMRNERITYSVDFGEDF